MAKTFKRWVLYVASDASDSTIFDPGSRKMISLINPIKEDVHVQSVDVLFEKGLLDEVPSWLQGTPTLVCTSTRLAYTGSEAIRKMEEELNGGKARREGEDHADESVAGGEAPGLLGAPPSGERFDVGWDEGGVGVGGGEADAAKVITEDRKVTEEDVQRFMAQRQASMPQGAPPPPGST